MKKKISVSVGDLVEYLFRSGDLSLDSFSQNKLRESILAHQKIQRSRPVEYKREVSISDQFETDHFVLEVIGRIDGIFRYPDRVIIEEIKTTRRSLDYYEKTENQLHWAQLKVYAYIYSLQEGLDEIEARLTYYQLDSGQIRELPRRFTKDELYVFFNETISRYLKRTVAIEKWCGLRDESIKKLVYPFPGYRQGQREMAVEVYRTIKNRGQMVVQAATGIGKTMAAVFPVVKSMAEGFTPKIFYLTARTTGRIAAEKAIDELRDKGLRLKSMTITARGKICFSSKAICYPDECEFAHGYYDRIDDALDELFRHDAFSREMIENTAIKFKVCPFEFSLELSMLADFIICDYNYVFDPKVYLRRFFIQETGDYVFLVDEAHNLVERSREMFSAEIMKQPFLDTRRSLKNELPIIYKSMGRINSWMLKTRKRCEEAGNLLSEKEQPAKLYPLLNKFLKAAEDWLSLNLRTYYREGLIDLYFSVRGFMRVAEQYDQSYFTISEKNGKNLRIKLFCVDPSPHLERVLKRCRAAVLFSATMTPAHYFKNVLGCNESSQTLEIPSPFPSNNLCLLIVDSISTLYRQRERTKTDAIKIIGPIVKQKKGNYLLFFPSYEYMKMIHTSFKATNPETETIVQTAGMSEDERETFLGRFAQENSRTLVGFAVMGGIFGEGIDLTGERLSGAVIFGVGLPGISPERELIREYFTRSSKAGFEYAYLYPGINRVFQAAGRVIRSEKERGIVILVDERFTNLPYKALFPKDWRPIRVNDKNHLSRVLKKFWGLGERT
ncbi:helicase C-terminal domain-containing protein [Thermodesulfobacteriota bacterium]